MNNQRLQFGDTVLITVPSWAHDDGSAYTRMAVVIGDLGPIVRVALTSTQTIRAQLPEADLRPRIPGDGAGVGNSLAHLSEVCWSKTADHDRQSGHRLDKDGDLKRGTWPLITSS